MNNVDKYAKILWDYNLMHHTMEKVDAIFALGSMDTRVAERAADLWHEGLAKILVVSGGLGRLTGKDKSEPEAEKFKKVLLSKNVPDDAILIENQSTNTGANLKLSMKKLDENGIIANSVIVITKPYAEKRTYATMKKLFPSVKSLHTSPQLSMKDYPHGEITKELMINILVGDTKRIEVYPSIGFTVPMDIPHEVEQAMNELIEMGYDAQLPL